MIGLTNFSSICKNINNLLFSKILTCNNYKIIVCSTIVCGICNGVKDSICETYKKYNEDKIDFNESSLYCISSDIYKLCTRGNHVREKTLTNIILFSVCNVVERAILEGYEALLSSTVGVAVILGGHLLHFITFDRIYTFLYFKKNPDSQKE